MNKLLALFCLFGLVYLAEGETRQELFHLIHNVGNEVRQELMPQIKTTIKETMEKTTSPEQAGCVNGYTSTTYKDLNMAIGTVLNSMRSQLGTKSTAEIEAESGEELKKKINDKLRADLQWFPARMEQIRNCLKQES